MRINTKLFASIVVLSILIILNIYPRIFSHWFIQIQEAVLKGGILIFLLVMIIQSIVSAIPAEAILILGGSAFGFVLSSAIGTIGLMVGALINYLIGLRFGKPIVERFIGRLELEKVERFFDKHGAKMIFAFRFIPWVSFDVVSYFSGITGIPATVFMIATFLGTIPRAFFYSYLGERIGFDIEKGETSILNYLLLATFLIIILIIVFEKLNRRRSGEA
ncbi:MAG: VTT domain-containing protein [Crenarchaeota archaeon]|nr:VTT domain-containing protein [Thermoproteota archaeon]MDW8034345.1 VTT domain-containing protein [Nitrososphaerota archaeon]